jgi:hypothetical protein
MMAPYWFCQLEHEIVYLEGDKLRECGVPLSKLEAWKAYEESMRRNFVRHGLALDETSLFNTFPVLPDVGSMDRARLSRRTYSPK